MPDILLVAFDNLSSSTALQLFTVSIGLVIVACAGLIWARVVRVSMLDNMPLSQVEREHPHLPSGRVIAVQTAGLLCLMAVLISMGGQPPFDGPYQFFEVFGVLTLVGVAVIVCELYSKAARVRGMAISLGTSVGLGAASVLSSSAAGGIQLLPLVLSGAAVIIVGLQARDRKLTIRAWPLDAHVLFVLSAVLWAYSFWPHK